MRFMSGGGNQILQGSKVAEMKLKIKEAAKL